MAKSRTRLSNFISFITILFSTVDLMVILLQLYSFIAVIVAVVQSLSCVQLFETRRTVPCQALLSSALSWSLFKFMSIELVMPSNHLVSLVSFSSCLQSFPASGSFPVSQLFTPGGQSIEVSSSAVVLPIFRTGFL